LASGGSLADTLQDTTLGSDSTYSDVDLDELHQELGYLSLGIINIVTLICNTCRNTDMINSDWLLQPHVSATFHLKKQIGSLEEDAKWLLSPYLHHLLCVQ
jgi:hypothetical protein